MQRFLTLLFVSFFIFSTAKASNLELEAPQAYMIDYETGEVLFDKNADQQMVPSSMTKIMTAYLVFDRLKKGDIKLDDTLKVSKEAWQKGGSRMFVKLDSDVSVEDLLKGVIVQSGNDASIVLAEGISGTETAFANQMTEKAHELGAVSTTFLNSTGWPDEGHITTAKDLVLISEKLIREFPKEYEKYFAIKEFAHNNINQGNRNTLLYKNMGADGIKTGRTDAGGSGIVASAKEGGRRLILVVNGLPTSKARDRDATALLKWGFTHFKNYELFKKGAKVDVADVWGGADKTVNLVAGQDVILTLPRNQRKELQAKLIYDAPLAAPLKAGEAVGMIEITVPEKGIQKIPLYVEKNVEKAGFIQRINNAVHYLLWGKHSS